MMASDGVIWLVILALGLGSYLMRFAFLGFWGNRDYPGWALRLLRYAPQAVLPGILVPMILPQDGAPLDLFRTFVAVLAFAVGCLTRNTLHTLLTGGIIYFGGKALGLA